MASKTVRTYGKRSSRVVKASSWTQALDQSERDDGEQAVDKENLYNPFERSGKLDARVASSLAYRNVKPLGLSSYLSSSNASKGATSSGRNLLTAISSDSDSSKDSEDDLQTNRIPAKKAGTTAAKIPDAKPKPKSLTTKTSNAPHSNSSRSITTSKRDDLTKTGSALAETPESNVFDADAEPTIGAGRRRLRVVSSDDEKGNSSSNNQMPKPKSKPANPHSTKQTFKGTELTSETTAAEASRAHTNAISAASELEKCRSRPSEPAADMVNLTRSPAAQPKASMKSVEKDANPTSPMAKKKTTSRTSKAQKETLKKPTSTTITDTYPKTKKTALISGATRSKEGKSATAILSTSETQSTLEQSQLSKEPAATGLDTVTDLHIKGKPSRTKVAPSKATEAPMRPPAPSRTRTQKAASEKSESAPKLREEPKNVDSGDVAGLIQDCEKLSIQDHKDEKDEEGPVEASAATTSKAPLNRRTKPKVTEQERTETSVAIKPAKKPSRTKPVAEPVAKNQNVDTTTKCQAKTRTTARRRTTLKDNTNMETKAPSRAPSRRAATTKSKTGNTAPGPAPSHELKDSTPTQPAPSVVSNKDISVEERASSSLLDVNVKKAKKNRSPNALPLNATKLPGPEPTQKSLAVYLSDSGSDDDDVGFSNSVNLSKRFNNNSMSSPMVLSDESKAVESAAGSLGTISISEPVMKPDDIIVIENESEVELEAPNDKSKRAKPRGRRISMNLMSPCSNKVTEQSGKSIGGSVSEVADQIHDLSLKDIQPIAEKASLSDLLRICGQIEALSFEESLGHMNLIGKIGEATFSEVFHYTIPIPIPLRSIDFHPLHNRITRPLHDVLDTLLPLDEEHVAVKIMPFDSNTVINGCDQQKAHDIYQEVQVSKALGSLDFVQKTEKATNPSNFVKLVGAHVCHGPYTEEMLDTWDAWAEERECENDRPDILEPEQLFAALVLSNGGKSLEEYPVDGWGPARSILIQICLAVAEAESKLKFEHRDLHWGNVLCSQMEDPVESIAYSLSFQGGKRIILDPAGVKVTIIDFTISRCEKDGMLFFVDMSDESYYTGKGDYQFDIYRMMRQETKGDWAGFYPRTNVMWIHYLIDKLLTKKALPYAGPKVKAVRKQILELKDRVLKYRSMTDLVKAEIYECQSNSFLSGQFDVKPVALTR
ncbi:Serine/threonine-protein kinase haspin [Phlyctochytrium planicorne]|nr:Serine/threonine-protein kinase haspin [Phlyctochytrium planicorne]